MYMNSTTINIKTDPKVKLQAQKIAAELGLNLSVVLNGLLKQFVRTEAIQLSLHNTNVEQFEKIANRGRIFAQQHNITEADILKHD